MKKALSLLLAFCLAFSLAACGAPAPSEAYDVTLTVPADLTGTDGSPEALQKLVDEGLFHEAVPGEDGSVTLVMSASQQASVLDQVDAQLQQRMDAMVGSEQCPSFTAIEADPTFTSFTVTVSSNQLSDAETVFVLGLFMLGTIHSLYTGTDTAADMAVDFVNSESGQVMDTVRFADLLPSQP